MHNVIAKYDNLIKRGFKDAYDIDVSVALILGNCSSKMHINVVFNLIKKGSMIIGMLQNFSNPLYVFYRGVCKNTNSKFDFYVEIFVALFFKFMVL